MDSTRCVRTCPIQYHSNNATSLRKHQQKCDAYQAHQAEGLSLRRIRAARKAETALRRKGQRDRVSRCRDRGSTSQQPLEVIASEDEMGMDEDHPPFDTSNDYHNCSPDIGDSAPPCLADAEEPPMQTTQIRHPNP
ncbi:hypothetical protein BDQ12DRAFT_728088 [Crucibulum laeve]|uniref:Uncharacterized protein n=1 Tax=Crucibulum laeve TaxID=68775 RepID=A0A5C3LK25_9AGAR|nr:hypothetical protein BDQ12DRAFT_728088 [Crucibulum laeve]